MKLLDISTPKFPNTFCKVDDEDFGFLNKWKWHVAQAAPGKPKYVRRNRHAGEPGIGKEISLHRFLLSPTDDMDVDHKNHDGLDNRRSNIRICTKGENNCNIKLRDGYKGVYLEKGRQIHSAQIFANGKNLKIGRFKDRHQAALAYNIAASYFHGQFAFLNQVQVGV